MNADSTLLYLRYLMDARQAPAGFMHLQWFAAEDEGRTEEPTEHKIRKAREEGKVAKSQDLTSSVILILGTATIGILSTTMLKQIVEMMRFFFERSADRTVYSQLLFQVAMSYFAKITLPLLGVIFIVAILINLVQTGFLFSVKPVMPDFSRIAPRFGKFFKRALFSQEAGFNLLKTLLKVVVIGLLGFLNIQADFGKFTNLLRMHFYDGFEFVSNVVFRLILEAGVVMLAISVADFFFQRRQYREQLKMSKQELKEERKMYEGDPLVKGRLRERMREIMTRNMLKAVPKADVVITNPTHFAVALEWDRMKMAAPTVTAKGADVMAHRIKEIAGENNVPVMENKPLARALFSEVEIGDVIPEKFYEVLATILAQIYKMREGRREAI